MQNTLTYQEFMSLSKQYYTKGGDGYYECWDERTFNEYVKMFGAITKRKALQMYKIAHSVYQDKMGY
jgi:hypothetical protein